jgi:peptidoglycan/xylan/chitin deacetylase (PgdA/CDA1 family)
MKHKLIRFALNLFHVTRLHRLLCPFLQGRGVILAMHRVKPLEGRKRIEASRRIEITPGFLKALVKFFMDKGYQAVSMDGVYERLTGSQDARPFVCFTFDDGYRDVFDTVYPLFRKAGIPLTVYVNTSFPDRTAVLWWYMLEDLVLRSREEVTISMGGRNYSFDSSSPARKEKAYSQIREMFMKLPQEEAPVILKGLFSGFGIFPEDYVSNTLDWGQLIEMSRDPLVTIGAHTVNHFNLRQLDALRARSEIFDSKHVLQEKTGRSIRHFAYPFGSRAEVGKREFEMVRTCGFKTAVTMREGAIFPEHRFHTECLPRIEITGRHQDLALVDLRRCGVISFLRNGLRKRVISA